MGETPSVSSGSETTGPTTFQGMSWSDAPSASTPTSDTTADSASADTTVPPAGTTSPDGTTPATGEPPKERWADILANARAKAAEEALTPLAWARDVNQQDFQQLQQIARHFQGGDPIAGLQSLMAEIRKDPQHDAAIRSLAARALAQRQQQSGPDLTPIQVQLDNGQTVGLYSADQIAALRQQWLNDVKQEMQPVTQTVQTLQQREAAAQKQIQIDHFVTTTYEDVKSWPGMGSPEAQKAVAQELAQARIDANDPREVSLALNSAYRKVVLPTLGQQAEAKLLDSLKTKAQASTSVNPGSSAPSAPQSVTRFTQLGPEAWR